MPRQAEKGDCHHFPNSPFDVATARDFWVPAVSNAGTWGRWAFYEVRDPWSCQKELRGYVSSLSMNRVA